MSKMLRCSLLAYLLLSLLLVLNVCAQDPAPARSAVTPDGTVRKGINRVLSLDGDGDYVEMADSGILGNVGSQVTVEVWIKATEFADSWINIALKRDESGPPDWRYRSYVLQLTSQGSIRLSSSPSGQGQIFLDSQIGSIVPNIWYHVAGIVDAKNGVMRIFINGAEVARGGSGADIHVSSLPLVIGRGFAGQMDELRIWSVARTQEEIRAKMHTTLSGSEPGLVGYWQFDDRADMVTDSSPNQIHGRLVGDAYIMEAELPRPDELDVPTVISGTVRDELGNPMGDVIVHLVQGDVEIAQKVTDALGQYQIVIPRLTGELYDLFASSGTHGQMLLDMSLHKGESRSFDLVLREAVSIQGTLMMLDNATPHVAVPVQAIRNGEVMATALSNAGGRYQLINLKPGRYQVRCQVPGGYVYYGEEKAREPESQKAGGRGSEEVGERGDGDILRVEHGKTVEKIDFRFAPFKKGTWRNYTSFDGLPYNVVRAIYRDPDGVLWIGTGWHGNLGGVSRYDGTKFVDLTTPEGLGPNNIYAIHRDPDGVMWFATRINGVFRYDGREFVNFTTQDGLAHDWVLSMHLDPDGVAWFGTQNGISRYDGVEFVNFTTSDKLAGSDVSAIYHDPDGMLWFGTCDTLGGASGGGVSRYDGEEFINFTTKDGLAHNSITSIHSDPDGVMWFGTGNIWFGGGGGGVSRYDGEEFTNFTTKDGLPSNCVLAIHRDPNGILWFGTDEGVSRYDGRTFVNFTTDDGLAHNVVFTIYTDADGAKWFGTGGGLSRYEEGELTHFTTRDGLVANDVWDLHRVSDDELWIGTMGGASRFDGKSFVNFTTSDGLTHSSVRAFHVDPDGMLWIGTWGGGICLYNGKEFTNPATQDVFPNHVYTIYCSADTLWFGTNGGIVHYDGEQFAKFTTADGLVYDVVVPIHITPDGILWCGTDGGISRYDGKEFTNFTTDDGLASNDVNAIYHAPDGVLWFGTAGGLSLYDGERFTNLTKKDGLVHNGIRAILRTSDDILWFGTEGGGVCLYDGTAWSSLDTRDGLAGDEVRTIDEDSDGYLWFGTDGGITRYRRNTVPPKAHIDSVTTDQTYRLKTQDAGLKTEGPSIPAFATGTRVTIEYSAIDFKTIPEKRQYRSRIVRIPPNPPLGKGGTGETEPEWGKPTKATQSDWTPQKAGTYAFEVQAIDRDLNYSEPASLTLKVVSPFYMSAVFLVSVIGAGSILLLVSIISLTAYTKRRRQVHAYQQLAVQELQDAR